MFDQTIVTKGLDIRTNISLPSSTVMKITSDGKIWAQEIIVQTTDPWPDYVFNVDYKLLPLNELANYINRNNHLPGMPSAEEVAANGINLGQMDARLLQKIEELTQYIIELQKEIDSLKKNK